MIQAVGKYILVKGVKKDDSKKSIIIVKDTSLDFWEVVSKGDQVELNVNVGQHVCVKGFSAIDVDLGEGHEKMKLISEDNIFAIKSA